MPVVNIVQYPNAILTQDTKLVEHYDDPDLMSLIEDMEDTLKHSGGIGLAAPQIGSNLSVMIINEAKVRQDFQDEDDFKQAQEDPFRVYINPKITTSQAPQSFTEGCLSMPGVSVQTERASYVIVEAFDAEGMPFVTEAKGYHAAALQHEIDHLHGLMVFHRTSNLRRRKLMKRYRQMQLARKRMSGMSLEP